MIELINEVIQARKAMKVAQLECNRLEELLRLAGAEFNKAADLWHQKHGQVYDLLEKMGSE